MGIRALRITAFLGPLSLCMGSAATYNDLDDNLSIAHGTLVVCVATPRLIVMATDSRMTSGKTHDDNSKKLFNVYQKRMLGIAGLAEIGVPGIPSVATRVAVTLDQELERDFGEVDEQNWNNPPLMNLGHVSQPMREVMLVHQDDPPYLWWKDLQGPLQTVFNIGATFGRSGTQPLVGVLAGFLRTGGVRIETLSMTPIMKLSDAGRATVAFVQARAQSTTTEKLVWKTAGFPVLADAVLGGPLSGELTELFVHYPGIQKFLRRRSSHTEARATESELVSLVKDLITATSAITPYVGGPVQLGVITPTTHVRLQSAVPEPTGDTLPVAGAWYAGVVLNDFAAGRSLRGAVFTDSDINGNSVPIPLDGNYFYGNRMRNATLRYDGGAIYFGENNTMQNCSLLVSRSVAESRVEPLRKYFVKVVHID